MESEKRPCIICGTELLPTRELTCGSICAKKYNHIGSKILNRIKSEKNNRCIVCGNQINFEVGIVCPNCQGTYRSIKEHLIKRLTSTKT